MSVRVDRIRGQIRKEIAEMLIRGEIHDPRLSGVVSITDVEVSKDHKYATVFFSAMGDPGPESCLAAFDSASGFIRNVLGRRLRLRQTPKLRFSADTSLAKGAQMDILLGSLDIPPLESD